MRKSWVIKPVACCLPTAPDDAAVSGWLLCGLARRLFDVTNLTRQWDRTSLYKQFNGAWASTDYIDMIPFRYSHTYRAMVLRLNYMSGEAPYYTLSFARYSIITGAVAGYT